MNEISHRLEAFMARGYRPTVRNHALAYREDLVEAGWFVLNQTDMFGDPTRVCVGWQVDARDGSGRGRMDIHGGTFASLEEALRYSERELDKYVPRKSRKPVAR